MAEKKAKSKKAEGAAAKQAAGDPGNPKTAGTAGQPPRQSAAPVLNLQGEEVGKLDLPEKVFGQAVQPGLLHEVTVILQNNRRSGSAHTKTRSEVSGGGKKPWRQKGTGRARQGSIRSPLWRKGGVVFGPRARDWSVELPRRKARKALAQALSARAADGSLRVLDSLKLDGAKTKQVAAMLKAVKAAKKSLIVVDQYDENLARAARNVPGLEVRLGAHLNAYEVLACRNLIVTKSAIEKLAPRFN